MHWKRAVARISLLGVALAAAVAGASASAKDDAVAAITKLENDSVKADLANDKAFYEKILSKDFMGGTSFGEWDTRDSMMKDLADRERNKTNSETMSDLKVQVHGNVAIARYTTKYDSIRHGEPVSRTVIATDTWIKEKDGWKLVAAHASEAKK